MPAAILTQGLTSIRTNLATLLANVGVSTNQAAFSAADTLLNPGATGTNLIKTSTNTVVDTVTFDSTMTITGASEFTGLVINTIGSLTGATAATCVSRTVRGAGLGIGVQSGDVFTVGVRWTVSDQS